MTSSDTDQPVGAVAGAISKSQGTPGKAPPPGPPAEAKPDAWVPTLDRGGRWRQERGTKRCDEDHTPVSPREPAGDPPAAKYNVGTQDDTNIQDGKRMIDAEDHQSAV